uniref:Solute carrier family 16 member 12b n=1 Tax=Gadus morhua TaxID=8049 RepID=A0A8C4Z4F6_GADMO
MHPGKRQWGAPPPDGGWGWVIVGCCFMVTVCTRAVTRCISIFFVEFQAHFGGDYSGTAWIHSLVDCTTMLCGKTQNCVGFALCYTPAIATVGCYFSRRKALAYGIAMSGSGIGTFVLAPAVQILIDYYSWRGALLILSGLVANLCVCGALLPDVADHAPSSSCKPIGGRRLSSCFLSSRDYEFLLLPDFVCLAMSFLLLASGCSLPFVYLVPYALNSGVSSQNAALLMSTLGAVGIVGNITFGWLTDRRCLKPYRRACYTVAVGMEGVCCVCVPLLCTFYQLLPFSVLYGYFDGAYVALIPVVTSDVVGPAHLSSALGVVYFLHAIPYLISPPVGGWLVDKTGSYAATFFLSGTALLASASVLSTIAWIQHCRRHASSKASPVATKANTSKDTEPLPLGLANQSDCFIVYNKEAKDAMPEDSQAIAS